VLLWFAGMSVAVAWVVFRDPAFDHRVLIAGALLPDVVDAPFGGARVAHTVLFSAALLLAVMLATRGRRQTRRRWLALPIGTFVHLLADGAWTRAETFWWPFLGGALGGPLPPCWCSRSSRGRAPWCGSGATSGSGTRPCGRRSSAPAACPATSPGTWPDDVGDDIAG
jgi:hypothetical protein